MPTVQAPGLPSEAHLDPSPTHRRRRTQLHTKPRRGKADPRQDTQHWGNMAVSAQRQAIAGGQGQGPARCGWAHASPPPRPPAPSFPHSAARPPPGFITQLLSHCSQFITLGGPVKA
jgi:hypothetical protein